MRTLHSVLFAVAVSALSACTGSAQVHTDAEYTAPQLVEVEPGVQVVADYDEPVFYTDNMYWRVEGGVWYRSQYHNRGWARVDAPPERVRHIERPEMYVHYHGRADVHAQGPEIRDHRTNENVITAPAPTPEVRDHRDEHENVNVNANVNAEAHERAEVRHDEHAEAHERAEVRHDEHAEAKDKKELQKDEKKRAKDERDERKH